MFVQDCFQGSLLVLRVELTKKLLDETTIKYTETRALTAIQTGCLGALHRSQSLTALNRWGLLVFNKEY